MDLLLLGFSLFIYFIIHSFLAHQKVKYFLIGKWIAKKHYRLFFNGMSVLFLLPIFWIYKNNEPSFLFKNNWTSLIGMGIISVGALLFVLALRQYSLSEFAGTEQLKNNFPSNPTSLQTSGLNAVVRHPLYFAMLLLMWGYFLVHPTDLFLVVAVVSTLYLYFGTKLEEEKLEKEFGEAYEKYKKEVPMLIPFLKLKSLF